MRNARRIVAEETMRGWSFDTDGMPRASGEGATGDSTGNSTGNKGKSSEDASRRDNTNDNATPNTGTANKTAAPADPAAACNDGKGDPTLKRKRTEMENAEPDASEDCWKTGIVDLARTTPAELKLNFRHPAALKIREELEQGMSPAEISKKRNRSESDQICELVYGYWADQFASGSGSRQPRPY